MIEWNNIDTVLLDMDGTLLDLRFDNYFWLTYLPMRYAEIHAMDLNTAKTELHNAICAHEGTLNWYCTDFWSETLNVNVSHIKSEIKEQITIRPFVAPFLQRLREHNKRLVLVTNAHPDTLRIKFEMTEIDQWLHLVVSSHVFRYPKEMQEFWYALQTVEPFDPARTLFIDDTERILDSAAQFGIQHLLGIKQPDSSQSSREILRYPSIESFDDIMPSPIEQTNSLSES